MNDVSKPSADSARNFSDRRNNTIKSFGYSLFMRRRRGMRRDEDQNLPHYVDVHDRTTVLTVIAILILSCTDSLLTLILIREGKAYEANPVMDLLIQTDTTLFVAAKAAITTLCVLFITAHKNFWLLGNRIRVHTILFSTLIGYSLLINYELFLLMA